jgi:hypothetical protein
LKGHIVGLFKKLTGGVDKKLLATGLPGRGLILEVRPHGTTVQVSNGLTERVCDFRDEVSLDNRPRYEATCKQRVPEIYIPQLSSPNAVVAVRANADQLDEIVLDLEHEAPTVTIARDKNATSAAEILAMGQPAQAVIVAFGPIGMKTPEGVEVQAFKLTVMPVDGTPYQVDVGNATPPEALPLLFPGSKVPVKLGAEANEVVIDWNAALHAA